MEAIDAAAITAVGIPRLLLMEHAGLAVARAVQERMPSARRLVLLCCGTGFNGGDGLAAARHLQEWGYVLHVALTGAVDRLRGECATYARILRRLGVPLEAVTGAGVLARTERRLADCGLIVDALLGIGMNGVVREPAASLIHLMNRSGKPIIAVDLPSGLDADTGGVRGCAVKAAMTVTFGLPKRGCFRRAGPTHVGTLRVDSITIPQQLLGRARP